MVRAATGEMLWIPPQMREAVREALPAVMSGAVDAEQTFLELLVTAMHRHGAVVAPLAFTRTTQSVSLHVYSMVLAAKHEVERQRFRIEIIAGPSPLRGTVFAEIDHVIAGLTGHAPPIEVLARLAALEDRLRHLRQAILGTPIEAPIVDTAIEEGTR